MRSFRPGVTEENVVRTLETGIYLRYKTNTSNGGKRLDVDSLFNLGFSKCVMFISPGGEVVSAYVE